MRTAIQGRVSRSGFFLSLIAACAVLAGCGGGGKHSPVSDAPPPNADGDSVVDAQDCAPNDASKWQLLPYQSVDMDQDSHRVGAPGGTQTLCSGASLPAQYSNSAADPNDTDCDDTSNARWRLLPYVATDADGDGYFIASSGQACSGATLASTYATTTPSAATVDCDDTKSTTWRLVTTYRDADGDGVGAGAGQVECVGTAAKTGFSFLGYDPLDDPSDPTAASTSDLTLPSWQLTTP